MPWKAPNNMSNDNDRPIFREVRGGRPPNDPLEELLWRFREYFKNAFGGGGGGPGRGGGRPPLPVKTIAYGVLGLLGILALLTSVYTVDVSEEAVVTRFQRYHSTSTSGLHFKLPFGIDRVTKVPSKVLLQQEFGFRSAEQQGTRTEYSKVELDAESLMLTGDLNVADVEWIVQFRISDPWKFLFHARDVQKNIRDISMSIMRRVVGDRLVGEILTTGRIEIADEATKLTQEVLDKYDMGITVVAVVLQDVTPPEVVKSAFNDVNAAKQEQEKAINVAEREYNNVIPEAKGKAEQVIADAGAFAVSLVNRAKGDASNFNARLVEYRRAPDVTRKRLYIEAMEEIFSSMDKLVIVDSKVRGVLPLYSAPQGATAVPVPDAGKEVQSE